MFTSFPVSFCQHTWKTPDNCQGQVVELSIPQFYLVSVHNRINPYMRRVPLNRRRWKRQTGVWNLNSKTNSVDLTHSWMVNTEDTNSQSSSCIGMDSVQIWKAALYCREARVRVVVCNLPTRLLSLCCTVWLASPIVAQISAYCIHLSMGGWMDAIGRDL